MVLLHQLPKVVVAVVLALLVLLLQLGLQVMVGLV
jgi:hypothetical protein